MQGISVVGSKAVLSQTSFRGAKYLNKRIFLIKITLFPKVKVKKVILYTVV